MIFTESNLQEFEMGSDVLSQMCNQRKSFPLEDFLQDVAEITERISQYLFNKTIYIVYLIFLPITLPIVIINM